MFAGLAFCEMLSQHPGLLFRGFAGVSSLRPKPSASICSEHSDRSTLESTSVSFPDPGRTTDTQIILCQCPSVTIGARQRSGEGVVRGNGRPKGCFWRVRFFSAPLRFALQISENLKGAEKKQTLQRHPFGRLFPRTTPSPLLWRTPIQE